jgi:hypothetical protein
MNKNQIIYKLFNNGFFPEDLPPEFLISGGSMEFLDKFLSSIDEFDVLDKRKVRKPSEAIQFTVPKNNHTRNRKRTRGRVSNSRNSCKCRNNHKELLG